MNQFVDNPVNIVLIMVFVLNAVLATLIFLNRGKSEGSGFFALSAYATSVWVVAMLYFRQISNIETLLLPTKTLYISGILIALLFFYFSYDFLGIRKITNTFRTQIFAFAGILTAISIYLIISSKIIINQTLIESGNKIVTFGDGYFGYSLLMVFLFFWSFTEFFKKIKKLAKEREKTNERLKELDQLKSEFVSLATHQIRGPLTAIKGYASMMRDGDYGAVPEKIRGTIDIIYESSNALTIIVQDFLDVSRIEQGSMKYEFTIFDFSKLAQSVGEELAPTVERRGLQLKLEIEPRILVNADAGKMRQVIGNLIDN